MKRKLNRIRKRRPQQAANQERKLHEFRKASALMSMRDNYDSFTPRWKGVIWTAEAELTAGLDELPWCNIKFACSMNGTSTTTWKCLFLIGISKKTSSKNKLLSRVTKNG